MAQKPELRGEVGCACVAREVSVERGDQHPAPVVPLERGGHRPVGARRVAVKLVDPRRALEVVPRDLRRDRFWTQTAST